MKTFNILLLSTLLISGLMSCEMKDEIFGKDIPEETGYLALEVKAGSSVSVETKASGPDKETFPLSIKSLNQFEYNKSYASFAKFKEENAEGKIELPIGKYEIEAHSPGEFAEKMSEPYYGGKVQTDITTGIESSTTVKCTIQNVQIKMIYDTEFLTKYSKWSITVDDKKGHSDEYTEANTSPAAIYWKIKPQTDKIYVTGTATLKEGVDVVTIEEVLVKRESPDYNEGDSQFFVGGDALAIKLAPSTDVDLTKPGISITVNGFNQETNDDLNIEVGVDGGGQLPEPPAPPVPGDAPSINIPQAVYTLPADSSLAGNANAVIKVGAGPKSVIVQIIGGNTDFSDIVTQMELGEFDLMTVEDKNPNLAGILGSFNITFPKPQDKEYIFPVGSFFDIIKNLGPTTNPDGHIFNITVEDNNGKTITDKLSVKVTE